MNMSQHKSYASTLFLTAVVLCSQESLASIDNETTGAEIMQKVQMRHQQFPYIYEEQSMMMQDRHGDRDTRKARRYSKVEKDGTVRFLLLFDYPEEVKGVALLANRDPDGNTTKYIYLPALGERLIESTGEGSNDNFLGTDFSVENLTGEILNEHSYKRRNNKEIEGFKHFVLDVYGVNDEQNKDQILRRHFIREDNLYITLTHHFDKQGRLSRVQSHHDLKAVDGDMWRANMILIRREKATSNVCTAQALLAVMASFYGVFHGPEGLRAIAQRIHRKTARLAEGLRKAGFTTHPAAFFDTITVEVGPLQAAVMKSAVDEGINLRAVGDTKIGITLDERTRPA